MSFACLPRRGAASLRGHFERSEKSLACFLSIVILSEAKNLVFAANKPCGVYEELLST